MSDPFVIETSDLRKQYGEVQALRGLNLQVPAGSIYGFLGRNGAGKTTTIKVLLGMARPTSGSARVFGLPADAPDASVDIRRRIGFVGDEKDLYAYMTVDEMIRFTAAFFPRWRADLEQRYVRAFDLPQSRKVKSLSRGTRTKLALLLALCRGAELLILDEPTSGLDPLMQQAFYGLVREVTAAGRTVFLSSHLLAEVQHAADRVAVIREGRLELVETVDVLRRRSFMRVEATFAAPPPADAFAGLSGVRELERRGPVVLFSLEGPIDQLVKALARFEVLALDVHEADLEDIFLELYRGDGSAS